MFSTECTLRPPRNWTTSLGGGAFSSSSSGGGGASRLSDFLFLYPEDLSVEAAGDTGALCFLFPDALPPPDLLGGDGGTKAGGTGGRR